MTYFGSPAGKIALQNGGEIQDSCQTRMFHNTVNVHLNHLKLSESFGFENISSLQKKIT
jgi:hypothetical protein